MILIDSGSNLFQINVPCCQTEILQDYLINIVFEHSTWILHSIVGKSTRIGGSVIIMQYIKLEKHPDLQYLHALPTLRYAMIGIQGDLRYKEL